MSKIFLYINKNSTHTEDIAIGNLINGIKIMPFDSTVKGLAIQLKNANGNIQVYPFESINGISVKTKDLYFFALTWMHSDNDYTVNVLYN